MGKAVALSTVPQLPLVELWPGYFDIGGVVLLAAPSGWGKSSVMYSLAAIISRGLLMPDGSKSDVPAGTTLLAEYEDKLSTMMVHKVKAARAKLSKVKDITDGGTFALPDRIGWLAEQIDDAKDCRLVVINPISSGLSISLTSGVQKMRRTLIMPLEKLAESREVCIVLVGHVTKAGRIAGSSALYEAPRTVLQIKETTTPGIFMLMKAKSNNSKTGGGIPFRIVGTTPQNGHVVWLDANDYADLTPIEEDEPVVAKITDKARIIAVMTGAGPMEAMVIREKIGTPWIKPATVRATLSRMVKLRQAHQPQPKMYELTK